MHWIRWHIFFLWWFKCNWSLLHPELGYFHWSQDKATSWGALPFNCIAYLIWVRIPLQLHLIISKVSENILYVYLRICFYSTQCSYFGLTMNWISVYIEKHISGLVFDQIYEGTNQMHVQSGIHQFWIWIFHLL